MAPSSVRRWFRHRQGDGSVIGQAMVPSSARRWLRHRSGDGSVIGKA
ncbi:hypothetical protein GGR07_001922, partial [Bacteroides pyogenes]|nr:hypothetical protein [Bacteroides pyogenes]